MGDLPVHWWTFKFNNILNIFEMLNGMADVVRRNCSEWAVDCSPWARAGTRWWPTSLP